MTTTRRDPVEEAGQRHINVSGPLAGRLLGERVDCWASVSRARARGCRCSTIAYACVALLQVLPGDRVHADVGPLGSVCVHFDL